MDNEEAKSKERRVMSAQGTHRTNEAPTGLSINGAAESVFNITVHNHFSSK